MELELSDENARPLAHLFEAPQVQRLVIGELEYPNAWRELRGRGSRNGRLPGPGSAENDGQPSPTNCCDQPANEARTGKDWYCVSGHSCRWLVSKDVSSALDSRGSTKLQATARELDEPTSPREARVEEGPVGELWRPHDAPRAVLPLHCKYLVPDLEPGHRVEAEVSVERPAIEAPRGGQ